MFNVRNIPPFLMSRVTWYVIGTTVFSFGFAVAMIWLSRTQVGGKNYTGIVTGAILGYFLLSSWYVWWFVSSFSSLRKRVIRNEIPCWHCGYDLTNSESEGVCPECGNRYTHQELNEKWARMHKLK